MAEILAVCKWCNGSGREPNGTPCKVCHGNGSRIVIPDENNKPIMCAWCKGTGREPNFENKPCKVCHGVDWAGRVLPKS